MNDVCNENVYLCLFTFDCVLCGESLVVVWV
jgi:hypothetical protein